MTTGAEGQESQQQTGMTSHQPFAVTQEVFSEEVNKEADREEKGHGNG